MRAALVGSAVAVLAVLPRLADASPGAIAIPPLAIELGVGTPLGGAAATSAASTELRAGGSWASLYWRPTRFDVAIGYVGSYRTLVLADTARSLGAPSRELELHGAYLELGYAIENHRHWRTWLGARVETMAGDYGGRTLGVVGGAVRISSELYSTGVHGGSDNRVVAMFAGAFALGVYVEGTARTLPRELGPVGVGAGVSMRIPFIAAIGS